MATSTISSMVRILVMNAMGDETGFSWPKYFFSGGFSWPTIYFSGIRIVF